MLKYKNGRSKQKILMQINAVHYSGSHNLNVGRMTAPLAFPMCFLTFLTPTRLVREG